MIQKINDQIQEITWAHATFNVMRTLLHQDELWFDDDQNKLTKPSNRCPDCRYCASFVPHQKISPAKVSWKLRNIINWNELFFWNETQENYFGNMSWIYYKDAQRASYFLITLCVTALLARRRAKLARSWFLLVSDETQNSYEKNIVCIWMVWAPIQVDTSASKIRENTRTQTFHGFSSSTCVFSCPTPPHSSGFAKFFDGQTTYLALTYSHWSSWPIVSHISSY